MLKKLSLSSLLFVLIASTTVSFFVSPSVALAEDDLTGFTSKIVLDDANASTYVNLMSRCLQRSIKSGHTVSSTDIANGRWFKGMVGGGDSFNVGRYADSQDGKLSCDDDSVNVGERYATLFGFSSNTKAACELGYRPKDHKDYTVEQCVAGIESGQTYILTNDTLNKSILQGGSPRGENATGGYTYTDAQKYLLYKHTLDNYCRASPVALVDGEGSEDVRANPKVTLVNQQGKTYQVFYQIGDGNNTEPVIFDEGEIKCSDLPRKMDETVSDYARWIAATKPPASDNVVTTPKDGAGEGATSCDSTYTKGIGWIICPITNFLASGMDWLFRILSNFLVVAPLSTDQTGVIYRAWGFMRSLANVLFVFGFLVIIYSQITSFGLSSYGVKRLLPRLIMAAILVNVSYWIAAIAVDLSNALGYAFQEMFVSMRNSLVLPGSDSWQIISWESVAGFILSGGAIAAGVGILGVSIASATVGGALFLLVPILVGVLLSALAAILVLAARQALITVLVILSPLACVAFLLPNTEKYFERWRGLFTTLLLVFPIFSIVFGGAQLAGTAIIHSAKNGGPNSINLVLLGMAVQVVPLAITPLLIKVSGNLLGKFAGMVNNPNRGLLDQTRNFSNERSAQYRARRLGGLDENGNLRYNGPGTRLARRMEFKKRTRAGYQKAYEHSIDAEHATTQAAHQIHATEATAHLRKASAENEAEYLFNRQVQTNAGLQMTDFEARRNQRRADNSKTENDIIADQIAVNPALVSTTAAGTSATAIANELHERAKYETSLAYRKSAQKSAQQRTYTSDITADHRPGATPEEIARAVDMRNFAGNVDVDPYGAARILNIAQEADIREREGRMAAADATLKREGARNDEILTISLGSVPTSGRFANFPSDLDSRSQAVRRLVKANPMSHVHYAMATLDLSSTATGDAVTIRSEFAGSLAARKPFWLSETRRTEMLEGTLSPVYNGVSGRQRMVGETLNSFGFDASTMISADRDDLGKVIEFLDSPAGRTLSPDARRQITSSLDEAFDKSGPYEGQMGKRRAELNKIRTRMGLPPVV